MVAPLFHKDDAAQMVDNFHYLENVLSAGACTCIGMAAILAPSLPLFLKVATMTAGYALISEAGIQIAGTRHNKSMASHVTTNVRAILVGNTTTVATAVLMNIAKFSQPVSGCLGFALGSAVAFVYGYKTVARQDKID